MKFGTAGTGDGQFDNPGDVAVNSVGQVYVSEALNSRVQKFTASGVFLTKFGVAGAGDGQFSAPNGVAVNASGEIYVADTANDRIQKFTASGGFLSKFGVPGNGDGQFNEPQDVAVSRTGEIFIVDTLNHRIQKWFDLDAWVSGSPHLAAAAVGPGKLLGESLTLDAARGLVVDGATVIDAGGTLAQQGGQVSTGSCTNNGQFTINGSTLTLTAGTLINNAALALVAGTVAGKVVNSYGGVMLASGQIGQLDNYAQLTLTGVLQVDGAASNLGTMAVSAAKTLRQNALLDNYGVIELSGGGISGAGSLGNHAGAVIRGSGSVAVPLTNDGGLVHATDSSSLLITDLSGGNTAGGELRIDNGSSIRVQTSFSNYGLIYLKGANAELSGGVIGNYRTIRGEGWISNRVNNNGVLRARGRPTHGLGGILHQHHVRRDRVPRRGHGRLHARSGHQRGPGGPGRRYLRQRQRGLGQLRLDPGPWHPPHRRIDQLRHHKPGRRHLDCVWRGDQHINRRAEDRRDRLHPDHVLWPGQQ